MENPKFSEIPPELSIYTPRPVRLSAAGRFVVAFAVALVTAGFAVPTVLWLDRESKDRLRERIEREGIRVQAEVTHTGRTGGDSPQRFAEYTYQSGKGRVVLRNRDHRSLAPGDFVQVRYLPGEPGRSWAVGYEPTGPPLAVLPLAGVAFFVGAVVIVVAVRRQWRLLAEGRATVGRIITIKRKRNSEGGTSYRAEYEITLLNGSVRRIWAGGNKRSAVGSLLTVLYDPENPKRLSSYPLQMVRIDRD